MGPAASAPRFCSPANQVRIRSKAAKVKVKWASQAFDPSPMLRFAQEFDPPILSNHRHRRPWHPVRTRPQQRTISIDGITLHLAQPMTMAQEWIGNREIPETTAGLLARDR